MTSIKQHQPNTVVSTSNQLTPIAVKALKFRAEFFDHLDSLPCPFNENAKKHYINRLVRSEGHHMLGEYSPFFLADILQISYEKVAEITTPWLVLYQHSLLIDDIVDAPNDFGAEDVLLSQILFSNFMLIAQKWFSRYPELFRIFCNYQGEGLMASYEELKQSPNIGIDSTNIKSIYFYNSLFMGRKAALIKFCASILNLENNGEVLKNNQEIGIDRLCAGIQLLDDLTDSVEDYKDYRYNYPLQKAIYLLSEKHNLTLNRTRLNHLSNTEILSIVILSGVIKDISDEAGSYLSNGIKELNIMPSSMTGKYLLSLIEENAACVNSLSTIIEENFEFIDRLILSLKKNASSLEEFICIPQNAEIWRKMNHYLGVIASAKN